PSFQMSFEATLALVAGYQQGLPWMSKGGDTPLAAKIALWGGREIAGLLLVSLLAGTATIPYIAYHFHRISPYGVLANLMAMPVVSAWVMPAGILGLIRHRPAAPVHGRTRGALPSQNAAAVHGRVTDRRRHRADDSGAPARCVDRRGWQRRRRPR